MNNKFPWNALMSGVCILMFYIFMGTSVELFNFKNLKKQKIIYFWEMRLSLVFTHFFSSALGLLSNPSVFVTVVQLIHMHTHTRTPKGL